MTAPTESHPTTGQGDGRGDEIEALLARLIGHGVVLVPDGERLRVRAPRGVLTPEVRVMLARHRAGLHALVASRFRGSGACLRARGDTGLTMPCRRMSPCALPEDGRPCLLPPTCCLCGDPLPPSHRYLCHACANASKTSASSLSVRSWGTTTTPEGEQP